jgi:endonuclease/exonuclease/phosphatase family metal-dependent hydrolase
MNISPPAAPPSLTVINWNIYLGADIVRLVDGAYPGPIDERASALWTMVADTDFPRRAGFIAARIAELTPELVALQEVFRWQVAPAEGAAPTTTVDFLEVLTQELERRGARYRAFRTSGFTCAVPLVGGEVLTMQDSIVTLVRADLGEVRFTGAAYAAARSVPIGGRVVRAARCWSALEVLGAAPLRLVNTHLEFDRPAQREQARELLALLDGHPGATLLAGDFNLDAPRALEGADAGAAAARALDGALDGELDLYQALGARGFRDAWRERGSGVGFTATQPEALHNLDSKLDTRIDWILARETGPFTHARLLGASERDRALLGLWPSDHAGVTATLALRQG